jgi:hypothetical protein
MLASFRESREMAVIQPREAGRVEVVGAEQEEEQQCGVV